MSELDRRDDGGLTPYEPGISSSEVNRAVATRFLPASAAMVLGMFYAILGFPLSELVFLPMVLAPLALGFWAGLQALRRRLYPDAALSGRRSVLAGLLAPMLTLVLEAMVPTIDIVPAMGLFLLMGVTMAVAMFFAWLTPTPEELRGPRWRRKDDEGADSEELSGLLDRAFAVLRRPLLAPTRRLSHATTRRLELAKGMS